MDKIFEKHIGKNVEVYVEDILVKLKKKVDHLIDLTKTLSNLPRIGLKVKVAKCTFGVTRGIFLGHTIIKEGIKPHPKKIEAIISKKTPRTMKEVQKLNGGIVALGRFITQCADKCRQFFMLLKIGKKMVDWNQSCNKALEKSRKPWYIIPPCCTLGEVLIMYVEALDLAISAVLVSGKTNKNSYIIIPRPYRGKRTI